MNVVLPKKAAFVDTLGKPLTQSLFLELGYQDAAVYTLKEDHYEYNGKLFPSLKRLYIEEEDPLEYDFASKYLLGFRHWQRLCGNRVIRKYIEEWRNELEYRLRSKGVKQLLLSAKEGNYQAAKFFVDRGWDKRIAGRPSKDDIEKEKEIQNRIDKEYGADIVRLATYG